MIIFSCGEVGYSGIPFMMCLGAPLQYCF